MSILGPISRMPGIGSRLNIAHRLAFRGGFDRDLLTGGRVINGSLTRDPGNTGNIEVVRAGMIMGKVTASGKYAPSIIGVLTQAEVITATSVTVSAAQATELVRRVGATGTIRLVGPPAAAGTVATWTETYSAVNTTTGVITCSGLDAALIAGSFVCANDGTHVPMSIIPDGYGMRMVDIDGVTSIDVPWADFPIAGAVLAAQLLPVWPTDTSLQAWIRDQLRANGAFVLDYPY